jgi:hypothetical protein
MKMAMSMTKSFDEIKDCLRLQTYNTEHYIGYPPAGTTAKTMIS